MKDAEVPNTPTLDLDVPDPKIVSDKICTNCGNTFSKRKSSFYCSTKCQQQKWKENNPEAVKILSQRSHKNWCKKHPDRARKTARVYYDKTYMEQTYGLSLEQFDEILRNQNGVCAICKGVNENGRRLSIDHNHENNKIRGLLCIKCNSGIGQLGDSIEKLLSAVDYLRRTNG